MAGAAQVRPSLPPASHTRCHPDAMMLTSALTSGVRVAAKAARPAQRRAAVVVRAEGGIEKKVRPAAGRLRTRRAPRAAQRGAGRCQRSLDPPAGAWRLLRLAC